MLRNFDLDLDMSKIGKDLKVQLALPNKKIIKNIKNITNASIDEVELNGLPIFTFEIPHKVEIVDFDTDNIEIVDNDDINNIKEEMLIKVTWYNGTKVNWFRVSDITKEENEENTFMVVESKSLPSELRATNVSINKESIDIIEYFETVLYQSPWKLGTVSDKLKNTYRSFDDDKKTRYEAVMSGIETFGAILDWDEENRILNLKSIDDIREFRGVVLKRENYASSVSVQSSSEEIVTRLYSYGNEGLGIENSNPSGMPYIEDFSYFMSPFKRDSAKNVLSSSSYMSDELCHALLDLEDLKTEYNPKIQNLQNMINSAYTDLSRDMLALQEKQGQLITLQALLDTAKSTNDKDLIYQREMEIRDKELEISTLEENIENIKSSIEEWDRQIFNFQQLISTSSFTTELIDELSLFVYEKEFNDDRYIDSQELYEASLEQMEKYQSPVKSFSIDLDSFINSLESQVFNGRLQIGEEVIIKSNKLNMEYRSIILGYNVDFESGHFELNISDNLDDISALDKLASIIYKAESSSTILNNNKYKWDGITSVVDEVSQWRDKEISTVENRITAGANESIVIDNRGIQAHNPDFPDERLIMQSGVIALSKDGGKTWNTSITPDGVIAETIIGKLFAGNNLIITNESGSFVIDSTGLNVNMDSIKIMSGSEGNPKDMIDLWNNLLLTYEEILDDGLITQHEKNQLQKQWNTIIDINSSMLEVFEKAWKDLEDSEPEDSPKPKPKPKEYNDYILAYSELDNYLNVTRQSDGYAILDKNNREETTQVDSIVFAQKFKNYNEKKTIFESIIPLEFSNGKIEVLENGISLTYTKNSEIVTMLNLSEEGVRIDGKLLEINSRTEFNADLVMNAGVIKGADDGIIIDLNDGTIELNKPIKIGIGSNLVTKDDLEVLELEAYTVVLSNDNSFITTDKDGNNGDFSHAVSTVTVYKGATDDTSNWNITAVKSNGVVGALSGRTYTVTNMVGDSGKVVFTATHKSNSELSISKDFNIVKTKAGLDGKDGKIKNINLVSDGYVISYKGEQPLPAKQTIKMQAFTDGLEGIVVWEIVPYKNNIAQSPITKSVVNNTIEINELDFANSVDMIKVKITCDGLIDTATIVKISNGLDGNSGKDGIGIKSVKEYYATSTSNTTPPSLQSDWSETPKVTNTTNKYLWNYEVYTYSNGDVKETTKRVIGTHGATGATGNGITSVTNYYLATTLGTGVTIDRTATQEWTTAVQKTDPVKKYLWNYEEILYTNGSKIPTAPVIIGTHGEKGDKGAQGINAPTISLSGDSQMIKQDASGNVTPSTSFNITGVAVNTTITRWLFSVNGGTFGTGLPTGVTRSGNVVTVNPKTVTFNTLSVRAEDGTVTDTFTIGRAVDGTKGDKGDKGDEGLDGVDAITVVLTNESHTFAGDTTSAIAGSVSTEFLAFKGANRASVTIGNITGMPEGMTRTIDINNSQNAKVTFNVTTAMKSRSGIVTIPLTVDGKIINKTFSYSLSLKGDKGDKGNTGTGVKSAVVAYRNHTSGTVTPPTTGWVENPPTPIKGQYMWTRTITTYTDNSDITTYSVAYNAIDGGDGKGITSTTVSYAISTSGSTTPTNWLPTRPTPNQGDYMWTRTVIKYTDGTESTAYNTSYSATDGQKGDKGDKGEAGKGIKSQVVTYQNHSNGTTAPTGTWSDTPSPVKGQYLWTRTVTQYTEGNPITTYAVAYNALDGQKGATGATGGKGTDGTGISSTVIRYFQSTSGTVTPSGDGATTPPTPIQGQYNWTRTVITYTDGTNSTAWSTSYNAKDGQKGDKGDKGEDGAEAKLLYLSASAEAMTFNSDNTPNPATQAITFTANMQNTTGTATFTAIPYNGTTAMSAITLGGTGNIRTLTQAQFPATATRIEIKAVLGGMSDTVSVVKLKNGATGGTGATGAVGKNAIVGYLTNENITFPANSSGVVTSEKLAMANGVFKVFDGLTEKTGTGVTYSVVTQTGATGAITTAGAYSVSAISADNASITFRAIYNSSVTIDKVLTLSKSKEGVKGDKGDNAPLVKLSGETQIITQSNTGVRTPSASFTVVGDSVNTTISAWTYSVNGGTFGTGLPTGVTRSGDTVTVAPASITFNTLSIKATGGGVSDTFTIARIVDGEKGATGATGATGGTGSAGKDAYTVLLSNESHTFQAGTTNAVAGSTTTDIYAYKGTNKVAVTVGAITGMPTGMTGTITNNGTVNARITFTVATNMTSPSGIVTMPLTVDGKIFNKEFSYALTFKGDTGATGAKGATGSQGPQGATGTSVSSVTEYYLATSESSGIKYTDTRFTTAMQPMTATNKYLWNYEKINFSNNTSQPTIPVIIGVYGDKGQTGSTGATGRSITSITEHYLATSAKTGVTRSTSGWNTSMQPTTETNKYLWNYETVNWSSGTTPTYVEPIIIGVHGNKGATGADGVSPIVGLLTNESITLPANKDGLVPASSFTGAKGIFDVYDGITKKTDSNDVKYSVVSQSNITVSIDATGAYAVTAMPTGTTILNGFATLSAIYNGVTIEKQLNVSKSVTGATGATGASGKDGIAGKDGVGVKTTTITYSQSTSGTTAPTSGWSTSVPTPLVKGQYLWTKTTWTYTDNSTEIGYTVSYNAKDGNTGKDGIAGKDGVGISSTKVEYVGSTSGTTRPTSGWSTTIPAVAEGNYLWTKTTWTYTDNTKEEGFSVAKMGAKGDKGATGATGASGKDGIAGKDGKGINSTVITYMTSTSGTTAPTTGWGAAVPSLTKGQYLWTRTIWTYTDSTTETGYSVSYIAKDGNNGTDGIAGKDGVGIKSTSITYVGSTSGTVKPTSGWNTAVPTVAQGSFLWTRTIWTYTDNTTETGYSVARMGSNGATGETGATGASATSYWITASNNIIGKSQTGVINPTTITFKGFSKTGTANSALYAGRFIIQTSTNGTTYATRYTSSANQNAYTYTIPADTKFIKALFYQAGGTSVLLDEQTVPVVESAEGIQVGGRNLVLDSTNGGNGWTSTAYNVIPRGQLSEDWLVGETYTVSIKGTVNSPNRFGIWRDTSSVGLGNLMDYNPLTGVHTQTYTNIGDTTQSVKDIFSIYNVPSGSASQAKIEWIKIEKGTVATDWQPAPEDARTYKAWANSSDGSVDFTRVYPNENLISNADITTGGFLTSTGAFSANTAWFHTDYIPVAGMTKLVTSGYTNLGSSPATVYYNSEKAFVKGISNNGQSLAKDITIDSGIEYIRFSGETKDLPTLKLEKGTTPTIYTTNPSDSLTGSVPKYVGFSPLDSDKPSDYEWIINPEWTQASAEESLTNKADKGEIEDINSALGDKVNNGAFDELKTALELFQDSYKGFVQDGGQHEQDLIDLEGRMTQLLLSLDNKVLELDFLKTYMKFGKEGFMIGKDDSQIKMLLKNDRLSFMDAGQEVAFFSGQSFYINRGAIVQSLQVGEHKITNLGNGHTIFQWVGA